MENIVKNFPGVKALKNVDFDLKAGEVCGLLGENGAGKSTLMNVLGGIFPSDEGTIAVDGKQVEIRNSKTAEQLGISFIHQELSLFQNMDIATNIYIQNLPKKAGLLNKRKLNSDTREILSLVHLEHCRPEQTVSELKIGEQQLVEIGRCLAQNTRVLILDEPTSSLTDTEIKVLFEIVRDLKKRGAAVVFISHRMDEIYEVCDTVMVMRDGSRILKEAVGGISRSEVIKNMLGRDMCEQYGHEERVLKEELLSVKNLTRKNKLKEVSFTVRRGELVGIYGLLGSGRSEVLRSIFGLDRYDRGEIVYKGSGISVKSPMEAIAHGMAMVTEDRHKEGLVLGRSVKFNCILSNMKLVKGKMFVNRKQEDLIGRKNVEALSIKTPSLNRNVQFLSGGNQQKVVIAKWLNTEPELLMLDEPTRGIDIGAKREIYTIIDELLSKGMGVIMVSSELPELLGLCDHVVVLKEGRVAADLTAKEDITCTRLLEAAMGGA